MKNRSIERHGYFMNRRAAESGSRGGSAEAKKRIAEIERECEKKDAFLENLVRQEEEGNPFAAEYKKNYMESLFEQIRKNREK
jgi:hypothetical protein